MICPVCSADDSAVIESRKSPLGIRRRRDCQACGHHWSTVEVDRSDLIETAIREALRVAKSGTRRTVASIPLP